MIPQIPRMNPKKGIAAIERSNTEMPLTPVRSSVIFESSMQNKKAAAIASRSFFQP